MAGVAGSWKVPMGAGFCWIVSIFSILGILAGLASFLKEGIVCLTMAIPILLPMHALGYWTGEKIVQITRNQFRPLLVSILPIGLASIAADARTTPVPEVRTQTTSIIINASAEKLWPMLISMDNWPQPSQLIFKAGVAHAIRTEADGAYIGAKRRCVLSTGVMPETITVFEPYRRLGFDIISTPPPIKETNPFGPVDAPHQRGYFDVIHGEFNLETLPGNKCRLTGISKYKFKLYPAAYWGLWTDFVVHETHIRAMTEMKKRAERQ